MQDLIEHYIKDDLSVVGMKMEVTDNRDVETKFFEKILKNPLNKSRFERLGQVYVKILGNLVCNSNLLCL